MSEPTTHGGRELLTRGEMVHPDPMHPAIGVRMVATSTVRLALPTIERQAVRALAPYCVHLAECDVLMVNGWGDDCTCGLDALLGGSPSAIAADIQPIEGFEP